MSVQVGILSDTHGLLRPEVLQVVRGCDCLLHAGDIGPEGILQALRSIAPVYAVRGNNDGPWAAALPLTLAFSIEGLNFLMAHEVKDIPARLDGVDIAVYGHSHKYAARENDGCLFLNPGSCGKRRFRLDITMARLWIERGTYRVEKIIIEP